MEPPDGPAVEPPRSGLLVAALLAVAVAAVLLLTAASLALGLAPLHAVAAGVAAAVGVSTVAALVVGGGLLAVRRRRPAPAPEVEAPLPRPLSPGRQGARELVDATERRLLRAVEVGAPEADLMDCALDLQAARLRLARVMLAEDGELPGSMKDELLVAHRGASAWLRSSRLP